MKTVETLEDGNRDEEHEEIEVIEEKDGASAGARRGRWADLIALNAWCSIIPNGRVSSLGLYQRRIIVKLLGC